MTFLNRRILQRLIDPITSDLMKVVRYWRETHLVEFFRDAGVSFKALVGREDGKQFMIPLGPESEPGSTRIQIGVLRDGRWSAHSNRDISFRFDIPVSLLRRTGPPPPFTLYNIRFAVDEGVLDEAAVMPLLRGYFGVTKRHPFERLREHHRDAVSNRGHLLHKTWGALVDASLGFCPVFQISAFAETQSEIYSLEERAVDEISLAPKGLNVIPGGHAGIKMLHQLRLLDGSNGAMISIDQRDTALVALEGRHNPGSPCTHYRSGHLRKIASDRLTWIRPCWLNLKQAVAA